MLYSQFFMNEDRYVISASDLVEIIPCINLKKVPMLPEYAAGLMNYHGQQMPVIDLCQLLLGRRCKKKLSTRIIVVSKSSGPSKISRVGLMVEKATEVIVIEEEKFKPPVMSNPDMPTNGLIAEYEGFLVTQVSIEDIFEKLDERLFDEPEVVSTEK